MELIDDEREVYLPVWKVTFDGQFFCYKEDREPAGKPLPFSGEFHWAGHRWLVPGVYSCPKGLVVDLCMEVDPEEIRAVRDKWNLTPENDDESHFNREQLMAIQAEDPFHFSYTIQAVVNGKTLVRHRGCGVAYAPFEDAVGTDWEAQWVVDHYQLDKTKAWYLWRWSFPWGKPEKGWRGFLERLGVRKLFTLSLRLQGEPASVPGKPFKAGGPGEKVQLSDPVTGESYTLTVVENASQSLEGMMPQDAFPEGWEYPAHYRQLTYTLEPEPPKGYLTLRDRDEGDRPRMGAPWQRKKAPGGMVAASIGIIGGVDGPVAVFVNKSGASQESCHWANSSLHFQPVEEVTWLPVFHKKTAEDIQVVLKKKV